MSGPPREASEHEAWLASLKPGERIAVCLDEDGNENSRWRPATVTRQTRRMIFFRVDGSGDEMPAWRSGSPFLRAIADMKTPPDADAGRQP